VLQGPAVERMREFFDERCDKLSIVGYVRPPAGFVTSAFQERVKGGSLRRFDVASGYRNYQNCFGKFDAVFGRERVHLWKFDPPSFPDGCAVRDFCARLGIALPARRIRRLNESLSREMVSLLYIFSHQRQLRGYGSLS